MSRQRPGIKAAAPEAPELLFYDEIGEDCVEFVKCMLAASPQDGPITMRINSPGGDAFTGTAVYNLLAEHQGEITCHIDGIAMASASLIAMAADKIVAPENSFMLIHNPIGLVVGNADDHRAMAEDLAVIADADARVYARRSKQPLESVKALMGEDRLMGAKEARSLGYIDELKPPKPMAAAFALVKVPEKHRASLQPFFILAGWRQTQERLRAERRGLH